MFTTAQAAEVGVPRKLLSSLSASGAIERLAQGVYRMAGVPPAEHHIESIRAHWLAVGGSAEEGRGCGKDRGDTSWHRRLVPDGERLCHVDPTNDTPAGCETSHAAA